MQVDTNWYWNQHTQQHVIKVTTRKTLHPQHEAISVTYFHAIPQIVCNRTQAKKLYKDSLYF